jgi:hypothetical protein
VKIRETISLCGAAVLVAGQLHAADGIIITQTTTVSGKARTSRVQITKDRMRTEMVSSSGEAEAVVFDGARQVLWIINYDKKTYTELTKADIDRIGGQLNDTMAKLQEQLKNLPPERRAQMEQMLKGRGLPGTSSGAAKTEYRRAGTDKVSKWPCVKYEGYRNNQKTSELCTVEPDALGVGPGDFEITQQIGEFFKGLAPQMADRILTIGTADQGFTGVPVRRLTTSQGGGVEMLTELSDVSRQNIPDSAFVLPPDLTKSAIPFGR